MTRVTNSVTLTRENFNAKNKRILSTVFSTVLFLGCAIFVASRGYICFEKFLGKPEKVDISFKFTGTQKFPSISICTKHFFNEDVFDECQISVANYTSKENPVWVSFNSFMLFRLVTRGGPITASPLGFKKLSTPLLFI